MLSSYIGNKMENLDYDSQQRRETFALYGLAMYHAQCFEKSLVIIVSAAYNNEYLKSDFNKREELFSSSFKKTTGQLVSKLKEMVKIPDDFENTLIVAVKKRNWLAHDYFWENSYSIMTTEGREKMINELQELSDYFSKMDERMVNMYQKIFNKIGLTEEVVLNHLSEILKKNKEAI